MNWYILEVLYLGEIFVCALFDGPFYSRCPSNYSITSRDYIILQNLPGSRHAPNYMSRFQNGNDQKPAVFVEGEGSVLHHGVGTVRVDYQHHDQCQQPLRSHQGNLLKRVEEWWERISSEDCSVGCTWCPAVVPKLAEAKNWLNPAKGRVENRLQPPKPSSLCCRLL